MVAIGCRDRDLSTGDCSERVSRGLIQHANAPFSVIHYEDLMMTTREGACPCRHRRFAGIEAATALAFERRPVAASTSSPCMLQRLRAIRDAPDRVAGSAAACGRNPLRAPDGLAGALSRRARAARRRPQPSRAPVARKVRGCATDRRRQSRPGRLRRHAAGFCQFAVAESARMPVLVVRPT